MSEVFTARPRVSGLAPRGIVAPWYRVRGWATSTPCRPCRARRCIWSPLRAARRLRSRRRFSSWPAGRGLRRARRDGPAIRRPTRSRTGPCWRASVPTAPWMRGSGSGTSSRLDTGLPPDVPEGSRPREGYDPDRFTLVERYQRKAAELSAVLGWKCRGRRSSASGWPSGKTASGGWSTSGAPAKARCTGAPIHGSWTCCWRCTNARRRTGRHRRAHSVQEPAARRAGHAGPCGEGAGPPDPDV